MTSGSTSRLYALATLLFALLCACGGGSGNSGGAAGQAVTIGAAGGTASSVEGASVVVPAGALAAPVTIQVAKDGSGAAPLPVGIGVSDVFALTPHGTAFSQPVTLTLPIDLTKVPAGGSVVLVKTDAALTTWALVPGATLAGASISGAITGFSLAVAVSPPMITQQPADQTLAVGQSTTFTVVASARTAGLLLVYTWDSSVDQGATWTAIIGANAASYTMPAVAAGDNGKQFRVTVGLQALPFVNVVSTAARIVIANAGPPPVATAAVAVGIHHSLALKSDGSVWAWGRNDMHQLGDGSTVNSASPVQALGLPPIAKVAAGHYHSLALALDGSVWAWGLAIAVAGAQTPALPVKINLSGLFVDIAASDGFSVALRDDGTVWAWGLNNAGELGRGTIGVGAADSIPAQIIGLANVSSISVSNNLSINHALAVKTDGSVWVWGGNALGQLGDGTTVNRPTPFMVNSLAGVTEVRAAFSRSFARRTNGTIYTWGNNVVIGGVAWSGSQFGGSLTPQAVIQGSPLMSVFSPTMPFVIADGTGATSNAFALFISPFAGGLNVNAGLVMGAGANADGVLGNGTTTDAPSAVSASGIDQVASLTTSGRHVVAVKRDGSVWAWGFNSEGQLGDGTTVTRLVPTQVPGLTLN